jgi:hypothetical protein
MYTKSHVYSRSRPTKTTDRIFFKFLKECYAGLIGIVADVSGQPISPIFKGQAARGMTYFLTIDAEQDTNMVNVNPYLILPLKLHEV